jgi:DNA-binding response OmpR family regulator
MDGVRPHVLVVDDLADTADTMAALLALWGYDAEPRYCGASALAAARLRRPAAVLLDIGMAPMDGFTFAARLRELPDGRRTAVIAVSGHTSEAYQARGREVGITHYLVKPCDPCLVREILDRVVEEGGGRPGSIKGLPAWVQRVIDADSRWTACTAT